MNFLRTFLVIVIVSFAFTSCVINVEKKEEKKEIVAAKMETVSFHVSGMTCEIGCAKTIQSKLSKKEGIAKAKVVFTDSIATVNFDSNKLSKEEIITFIDGIAGGELYKASEITSEK